MCTMMVFRIDPFWLETEEDCKQCHYCCIVSFNPLACSVCNPYIAYCWTHTCDSCVVRLGGLILSDIWKQKKTANNATIVVFFPLLHYHNPLPWCHLACSDCNPFIAYCWTHIICDPCVLCGDQEKWSFLILVELNTANNGTIVLLSPLLYYHNPTLIPLGMLRL